MLDSKTVSCIANADARRQTPMLSRKWRCWTAKPFPDTATADARQQTPMLSRKRRCRTAKSFSDTATADARQQNQMLSRKTFAGFYEIVRETCIFSPRSSVLQIEGFSKKR